VVSVVVGRGVDVDADGDVVGLDVVVRDAVDVKAFVCGDVDVDVTTLKDTETTICYMNQFRDLINELDYT